MITVLNARVVLIFFLFIGYIHVGILQNKSLIDRVVVFLLLNLSSSSHPLSTVSVVICLSSLL